MTIRGIKSQPSMTSRKQFELIEEAGRILVDHGYDRKGIWTFAFTDDVYGSSRDELTEDYAGFGPAAFSTYGSWKVVNPELDVYVRNMDESRRLAFVAPKSKATDDWRKFARMIYDLRLERSADLPFGIKLFIGILRLSGYGRRGRLTPKGVVFSHELSKTVVESLPFPVQNPACVENCDEYISFKQTEDQHGADLSTEPIKQAI